MLVIIFIIMAVILSGCDSESFRQMLDNSPERQPGTYWSNEEKTVLFQVDNNYKEFGVIYTESDIINIYIYMVARVEIFNVHYDDADSDAFEKWDFTVISDREFTATVKKTTYFNVGDELTFHKISREEYEASLESMGAADDFIAMLGETTSQSYQNRSFNLAADFDDSWHVYSEEELNKDRGYSTEDISKLLEARRSPVGVPVFCAKSEDGAAAVSVTIQKISRENKIQTEDEYAEISQQNMTDAFESAGVICKSDEVISLDFAGGSHPAVTVHTIHNGIDIYETLVPVKQGNYYAVISATCFWQDHTMSILDAFQTIV